MKTAMQLQSLAVSFQEICEGERPWTALGNFMNDWWGNFPDRREELVRDALTLPEQPTLDQQRWAAFCAASAEYLCKKFDVPCPDWASRPEYILATPWFQSPAAEKVPRIAQRYRESTPEPFARRNIFCGDRTFNNKYEQAPAQPARSHAA